MRQDDGGKQHDATTCDDGALFDAAPYEVVRESDTPGLSSDRRRTLRQREDIDAGRHPLTQGPFHPFSISAIASPDTPTGAPFTCGSCRFRQTVKHHNRSYPKCLRDLTYGGHDPATVTLDQVANVSRGEATDVRAWWPACIGYEPGDQALSPDAARSIPKEGTMPTDNSTYETLTLEAVLVEINDICSTEGPDGETVERSMDTLIICGVPESAIDAERDATVWDDTEDRGQFAIRVESSEDEQPYRDALEAAGWEVLSKTTDGYMVRKEIKVDPRTARTS